MCQKNVKKSLEISLKYDILFQFYQTIINLITATKTKTGLTVQARLHKKTYKKGIKVSKIEMEKINIHKNKFHGEWNYTIKPTR